MEPLTAFEEEEATFAVMSLTQPSSCLPRLIESSRRGALEPALIPSDPDPHAAGGGRVVRLSKRADQTAGASNSQALTGGPLWAVEHERGWFK